MPRDPLPPLPRAYWVLWTGSLVNRAGTFVEPFAVLYLTSQRGFTPSQVGVVLVGYGVGAALSQILGGWTADHIGRRATLVGGMTAAAFTLGLLAIARGLVPITAVAFLVGLASDVYRPASNALVTDLVDPAERRRAFALLFWAVNLGFSVSAVAAGLVAGISYTLLFVVDAVTCLAFAVVVLVGIPHDPQRPPPADADNPAGYRTALADPVMLALVAFTIAEATVYFQNSITLPLAVAADGLHPRDYGLVLAVNGILIVALQPWTVRWLRPYRRMRVLALGNAVIGLGFWLTTFAYSVGTYALTVVVWTLGEVATAGLLSSLVADLAPPEARGRYAAVWGSSFGVATLLAPVLGTWTYQYLGATVLWAVCLVICLGSAAGFLALQPAVRRRGVGAAVPSPA